MESAIGNRSRSRRKIKNKVRRTISSVFLGAKRFFKLQNFQRIESSQGTGGCHGQGFKMPVDHPSMASNPLVIIIIVSASQKQNGVEWLLMALTIDTMSSC